MTYVAKEEERRLTVDWRIIVLGFVPLMGLALS
jgi:hypothetical protein